MPRSLQLRLVLVNIIAILLAVGLTAIFARYLVGGQFERYAERGFQENARRLGFQVGRMYESNQGWTGIQSLTEQLSSATGVRVVVVGLDNTIVGDSDRKLVGKQKPSNWPEPAPRIIANGQPVGWLYVNPGSRPLPPEATFLKESTVLLVVVALTAGVATVIFTFPLSRRLTQPLAALTAAARKMEKGDLSVRVSVDSDDEVGELGRAFNAMANGLARLEQLRRHMVADTAHELRTPLTNVRGYLEAARDGMVATDRQLLDNLYEETMLLNRLIDDLQDLAIVEAGQLRLEKEAVDIADVVRAALDSANLQATARSVKLEAELAPDIPCADADRRRVAQILRNLLNNALEFTPQGGSVTVRATGDKEWVRVEVQDTGIGIAEEHLPYVFERFYRVDPSRSRTTGGAGIGLAIVKSLTEAHGGSVWARSTPNAGSVFGFSLPAVAPVGS